MRIPLASNTYDPITGFANDVESEASMVPRNNRSVPSHRPL
jgi:hypothetical protein